MADSLLWCSPCDRESWFEAVVFDDGLGDDSERACVDCGSAVVVGLGFLEVRRVEHAQSLAA